MNAGSLALPVTSDDTEAELPEGYILLLQVDVNDLHPSDAKRIQFLNRYVLVTIQDNDSKKDQVECLVENLVQLLV